jgi:hypothetical protein
MNLPKFPFSVTAARTTARVLLSCAGLFWAGSLAAQADDAGNAKPDKPGQQASSEAHERKQDFADALALFQKKDHGRGEKKLLAGNRRKPETLGWYLESAGKLTQMALALRQEYDHHGAVAVAQRARALLAEAEKMAKSGDALRDRAAVQEMMGYLDEEILRDPGAAWESYERAKKIDPQSVRAGKAIEHLDADRAKDARLREKS